MRVIATAGHVDHGKSSIVMALTGTGSRGPIMQDLATALAELCERLHTRHAASPHEPRLMAATRFIDAQRNKTPR